MNNELQTQQFSPTPGQKKVWNTPEIQILNLREAQIKTGGLQDGFNFKSH